MNKWECYDCGDIFEEPALATIDFEEFYGVGGLSGHHTGKVLCCPRCGSEQIAEFKEEEEEEDDEDCN